MYESDANGYTYYSELGACWIWCNRAATSSVGGYRSAADALINGPKDCKAYSEVVREHLNQTGQ